MSTPTETKAEATPTSQTETQPIEGGEFTKDLILKQVEFYFSPLNLPSDAYLISHMDENHFVPISLIASFAKIQALTSQEDVIVDALKTSIVVELSEDKKKVKPRETNRRTRLILHNLPAGTTEAEVVEVFKKGDYHPSIKADVNNCWFATFETEAQATSGLDFIRSQTIKGEPIRARLKPEPLLRNLYTPSEVPQSTVLYGNAPLFHGQQRPWNPYYDQGPDQMYRNYEGKGDRGRGHRKGGPRGKTDYKGKGSQFTHRGAPNPNNTNNNNANRKKGQNYKRGHGTISLGPTHFPPLPSASKKAGKFGYTGNFVKYTQEQIVEAIQSLESQKPNNIPEGCHVIASESIKELETTKPAINEPEDVLQANLPHVPMSEVLKAKQHNHNNNNNNNSNKRTNKPEESQKQPAPKDNQKENNKDGNKKSGNSQKEGGQKGPKASNKKENADNNQRTWSQIAKKAEGQKESAATPVAQADAGESKPQATEPAGSADSVAKV